MEETCPGCGMTCEHEDSPRVTVDPDDPALDDDRVARFFWYHTSTLPDWPTRNFDPAAVLTSETRMMMGGGERVAEWAARQEAKALHVGTYEAAVHNMLRRIRDQADQRSQFYLYRVRLKPSAVVREGWLVDPSNCSACCCRVSASAGRRGDRRRAAAAGFAGGPDARPGHRGTGGEPADRSRAAVPRRALRVLV